jgi:hypothetical protein
MIVRVRTLALWMAAACALATYRLHSIETWPLGPPDESQEHHSPAQLELERYGLQPGIKLPPRRVPPTPSLRQEREELEPLTTAPPWPVPPPPTLPSVTMYNEASAKHVTPSQRSELNGATSMARCAIESGARAQVPSSHFDL